MSYGGLEIPAGALGDRYGQRAVITRIVIWWSLFTALTGSVSSFGMLLAVRFLFGAGEAGRISEHVRRAFALVSRVGKSVCSRIDLGCKPSRRHHLSTAGRTA